MKHEALLSLAFEAFQPLHVVAGAERGGHQGLRFAPCEDCAAVRARQNSGLNPDLANLIEGAAIRTPLLLDHLIAEDALAQSLVILFELAPAGGVVFRNRVHQFLLQRPHQLVACGLRMLFRIQRVGEPRANLRLQRFVVSLDRILAA